jgi:hypothetical protein
VSKLRVALPSLAAANGVGAPFPNATAKQREPGIGVVVAAELEHLGFKAIRARQPPRGDRDPVREHELQRAHRRQLVHERLLEGAERDGILVRQHDVHRGAHAVLDGVQARARLALRALRPARFRAVPAAGLGTRMGHRGCGAPWRTGGGNGRARRGANTGHDGIPWLGDAGRCNGRPDGRPESRQLSRI